MFQDRVKIKRIKNASTKRNLKYFECRYLEIKIVDKYITVCYTVIKKGIKFLKSQNYRVRQAQGSASRMRQ